MMRLCPFIPGDGLLFGNPLWVSSSNKPSIPDNVTWEPGIEYAPGGAKSESLKMDIVRPKGIRRPLSGGCLHSWRRISTGKP